MTDRLRGERCAAISVVVDAQRRVVESNATAFRAGDFVVPSSWLGQPLLDALDAAEAGANEACVGRDYARDTHWLVQVTVEGRNPWRARIVLIDATLAVSVDRHALLGRLVHALRNASFALHSIVETLQIDRPTGPDLDVCLKHLRDPADRISATTAHLAALSEPPNPALEPVTLAAVVEAALKRIATAPRVVHLNGGERRIFGDPDLLGQALASMLDGGGAHATLSLDVDAVPRDGGSYARLAVERPASDLEVRAGVGVWDVAAGYQFAVSSRLAVARAVVLAHGGDVLSEVPTRGWIRLGIRLPLYEEPEREAVSVT